MIVMLQLLHKWCRLMIKHKKFQKMLLLQLQQLNLHQKKWRKFKLKQKPKLELRVLLKHK